MVCILFTKSIVSMLQLYMIIQGYQVVYQRYYSIINNILFSVICSADSGYLFSGTPNLLPCIPQASIPSRYRESKILLAHRVVSERSTGHREAEFLTMSYSVFLSCALEKKNLWKDSQSQAPASQLCRKSRYPQRIPV